jgi:hypothetical protein
MSSAARTSIAVRSRAASGRPAPRYELVGVVVVPNDCDVNCSFGMSYTPEAITMVIAGSPAPMSGYAPLSWSIVMCSPTMRPSRVAPISTDCS